MKPAGNLGFGNADTMEPPDLRGLQSNRYRPTQPLAVLPGVGPASPGSLPQNLPFEFGEYSQQTGHGSTGRCSEVQRLGQRNDPDVEMFQFLKSCQQVCDRPAPAVQSPIRALHRCPGDAQPPRFARGLLVLPHRSQRPGLARQWSSHAGRHTHAWRGSASVRSADRWWKRGPTVLPGTFSPVSVAGQKRYRVLALERSVFRPFSSDAPASASVAGVPDTGAQSDIGKCPALAQPRRRHPPWRHHTSSQGAASSGCGERQGHRWLGAAHDRVHQSAYPSCPRGTATAVCPGAFA